MSKVKNNLAVVRVLRGMSQKDLAEKINKDLSYISCLESGVRTPSIKTVDLLSKALDVPLTFMMAMVIDRKDLAKQDKGTLHNVAYQLVNMAMDNVKHQTYE